MSIIHQEKHTAMSPICEFIRNLLHLKDPRILPITSGFMRKIISKFCGLPRPFKQQNDKAAMSTNPFDEHPRVGLLHEAEHNKELHEPFASPISTEQQKVTEEEKLMSAGDSMTGTEVKTDEDEENYVFCRYCRKIGEHYTDVCPNRSKDRVLVCAVCRDTYPCVNQKEHGEKGIEVSKYCYSCFLYGHWTQDCEAGHEDFLDI